MEVAAVTPPVFRPAEKADSQSVPAVIPIIRAPDDPGVEDEIRRDEFDDEMKDLGKEYARAQGLPIEYIEVLDGTTPSE